MISHRWKNIKAQEHENMKAAVSNSERKTALLYLNAFMFYEYGYFNTGFANKKWLE
jgi:hypothetical protein